MESQEQISNNTATLTLDSLESLVDYLGIQEWDAIVIGDGSGSTWQNSCGWAAVLIDKYSGVRKVSFGAASPGTSIVSEILPYLFALNWYTSKDGPGPFRLTEKRKEGKNLKVHVVSDSEIVVNCGNRPASRKTYKALWAAMDFFANQGYSTQYHHVKRNVVRLNIVADAVAKYARLSTKNVWNDASTELKKKYKSFPTSIPGNVI